MTPSGTFALLTLAATASANVLRIPVTRISPGAVPRRDTHPRLSKRASFTEFLVNDITSGGYYASVSVGSPGQALNLILDTGSSDAFVVAKDADLCEKKNLQEDYRSTCQQTFDPSQSSTYQVLIPGGFSIKYLDGTTALGDYITDTFEIGGATVNGLQMGLAKETATGTGILGIGFTSNEAAASEYPNLIDQLMGQSLIPTRAYSLYLNDFDSSTGSILFGGVDSEKFLGELAVVPILPDAFSQQYTSFTVGLTALLVSFPNGTTVNETFPGKERGLETVLDSGTTLTYFPGSVVTPVLAAVGAYTWHPYASTTLLTLVDCALANSGVELTFRFDDTASIVVPMDELVIDAFGQGGDPADVPFAHACIFGIQNLDQINADGSTTTYNFGLLGDTFLRSAYVVYDIDNRQVGLAQANLNSNKSNVLALSEGLTSLPVFTGVENPEGASGVSNGSVVSDTGTTGTSSTSASSTGTLSMSDGSNHVVSFATTGVGSTTSPSMVATSMPTMGKSISAHLSPCDLSPSWSSVNNTAISSDAAGLNALPSVSVGLTNSVIASSTVNSASPLSPVPWNQGLWGPYIISASALIAAILFHL